MHRIRLAAASMALLVTGATLSVAGPAFADDTTTSLALCSPAASAPLYTTKCAPLVNSAANQVTVTLPGVGMLTFNLTNQNTIDTSVQPTVSLVANNNFSAGTPKISADGTRITVSFVNIAKPAQEYKITVKVSPPTSAAGAPVVNAPPVIKAVAGPNGDEEHESDDQNEGKDEDQKDAKEHDDAQGANQQGQQGQQGQKGDDGGNGGGGGD